MTRPVLSLDRQSEPFEDMSSYRGDISVGLKFVPETAAAGIKPHSTGLAGSLGFRKLGSMKAAATSLMSGGGGASSSSSVATESMRSVKGALHVLVKEGKNLQAVKASGSCDAFCKR